MTDVRSQENNCPRWACALLVVPAAVITLLLGVFAGSYFKPVVAPVGGHAVGFGYGNRADYIYTDDLSPHYRNGGSYHSVRLTVFQSEEPYIIWWR